MSATQVSFAEFAAARIGQVAAVESTPPGEPSPGLSADAGLVAQSGVAVGECPAVDKYGQVVEPGQFVSWHDQGYRVLQVEGDRCLVVGAPVPGQRYADHGKGWLRCLQICVEY